MPDSAPGAEQVMAALRARSDAGKAAFLPRMAKGTAFSASGSSR